MTAGRTGWNENSGTLRVTYKLPAKIDLKFTLNDKTQMPFFAPVRLDKFGGELKQTKLFGTTTKCLEPCSMNPVLPLQIIE